jgi:hypothetical protein
LSHTLNDCQEVADIVDRGLDLHIRRARGALTFDRRDDLRLSSMKPRFIR